MNICESEVPITILAKTCGCKEKKGRKVTYSLVDASHALCVDKNDIVLAELDACVKLLKYVTDENDKKAIETEMSELKMTIDLMN
jgi:hypothetical protein